MYMDMNCLPTSTEYKSRGKSAFRDESSQPFSSKSSTEIITFLQNVIHQVVDIITKQPQSLSQPMTSELNQESTGLTTLAVDHDSSGHPTRESNIIKSTVVSASDGSIGRRTNSCSTSYNITLDDNLCIGQSDFDPKPSTLTFSEIQRTCDEPCYSIISQSKNSEPTADFDDNVSLAVSSHCESDVVESDQIHSVTHPPNSDNGIFNSPGKNTVTLKTDECKIETPAADTSTNVSLPVCEESDKLLHGHVCRTEPDEIASENDEELASSVSKKSKWITAADPDIQTPTAHFDYHRSAPQKDVSAVSAVDLITTDTRNIYVDAMDNKLTSGIPSDDEDSHIGTSLNTTAHVESTAATVSNRSGQDSVINVSGLSSAVVYDCTSNDQNKNLSCDKMTGGLLCDSSILVEEGLKGQLEITSNCVTNNQTNMNTTKKNVDRTEVCSTFPLLVCAKSSSLENLEDEEDTCTTKFSPEAGITKIANKADLPAEIHSALVNAIEKLSNCHMKNEADLGIDKLGKSKNKQNQQQDDQGHLIANLDLGSTGHTHGTHLKAKQLDLHAASEDHGLTFDKTLSASLNVMVYNVEDNINIKHNTDSTKSSGESLETVETEKSIVRQISEYEVETENSSVLSSLKFQTDTNESYQCEVPLPTTFQEVEEEIVCHFISHEQDVVNHEFESPVSNCSLSPRGVKPSVPNYKVKSCDTSMYDDDSPIPLKVRLVEEELLKTVDDSKSYDQTVPDQEETFLCMSADAREVPDVCSPGLSPNKVFAWNGRYLCARSPTTEEKSLEAYDEQTLPTLPPLQTCSKPRRIGLSKRQRIQPLHQTFRKLNYKH